VFYAREKTALAAAEAARANEVSQRIHAQTEAAKNAEAAGFMRSLFDGVAPEEAKGRDITLLKGILDAAGARIGTELARQPEVEAWLRDTIGGAYQSLGLYNDAQIHMELARTMTERVLGLEDPETLRVMGNLALLYSQEGKHGEAETLHRQTLDIRKRVLGAEAPNTLWSMSQLARVYLDLDKYADAEALGRQTLEVANRVLGPEHPETLGLMGNLATAYSMQSKYAEAEALERQTLEIATRTLGPEHPDTFNGMNNLASTCWEQSKFGEAETLYKQTFELRRRVLGREHPTTLESMLSLAYAYSSQKKYREAEVLVLAAYESATRQPTATMLGGRSILHESLSSLVRLYQAQSKPDEAAKWQQKLDEYDQAAAARKSAPPEPKR
jgi:hypothetical protein